jgi:hypothetical protein
MDRRYDSPTTDVRTDDDTRVVDEPGTTPAAATPPPPPIPTETTRTDRPGRVVTEDRDRPRDRVVVDHRDRPGDGIREARERYGGLDIPAVLSGMLVGLAMLVILAGLASAAIGELAFQTGIEGNQTELSVGALITAGAVLFLSFLTGGWAAGRMARYNGALNGFMVALTFVILLGVLAALGAIAGDAYNLFDNLQVAKARLPDWFSADTVTTAAIVSAIAFAVVTFLGAILGGLWGARFHRRVDEVIASRTADEPLVISEADETRDRR